MPKPILFFAFANAREQYLRELPEELRQIREALHVAEQADVCEIVERANASVQDIFDVFQDRRYKGRIAVLHYGGHASDYQLLLETASGNEVANTDGLVPFLCRQTGLSLVFLNGCCTQLQGEELSRAGIPSVICTYKEILDKTARDLAVRFYEGLGQGLSLEQSWLDAADEARTQLATPSVSDRLSNENKAHKDTKISRDIMHIPDDTPSRFPWDLLIRSGAEDVRTFNLPQLARQPLFGLPDVLSAFDLPEVPFRFLDRYRRADAPVFFGRGNVIRDVYNRSISSQSSPVILFHGQSGVGKSSLLEAGLLPYLEATAMVRYVRRDPQLGLLAALHEALNFDATDTQMFAENTDKEEDTDINADAEHAQLNALRDILKNMPPSVSDTYRQQLTALTDDLEKTLNQKKVFEQILNQQNITVSIPDSLQLAAWKKIERNAPEKRLIIIIDQAEEVFTRPLREGAQATELTEFLSVVQSIFDQPTQRPRGKLILSYRKEFDANLEKAFAEYRIPREKVFLDRLDTEGVCEVVEGLTTTERLRRKYRVTVEDGLAAEMATDFLLDADSPISTVLQIVLTKLWQQDEALTSRFFRLEDYRQLRADGILLSDFFNQQIDKIRFSEQLYQKEAEKTGLALDILNLHTTQRGTAESRNIEQLRQLYEHRNDILEALIQQFEQLYLLTRLDGGRIALAHDTLAPVIQNEMRQSDRPGQRALRLLETKILDFERNGTATVLEEDDLALVENGQNGMRMWLPKEIELIEKSRKRRTENEKRRRQTRFLLRGAAATVCVLAIVASFFWWKNARQARVNELVRTALQQEKENPTAAYETIKNALAINSDDASARQVRHDIYAKNEFYTNSWRQDSAVGMTGFVPMTADSLLFCTNKNLVTILNRRGETVRAFTHPQAVMAAVFSPDGQLLITASFDTLRVWNVVNGGLNHIFSMQETETAGIAIAPTGNRLAIGGLDGTVVLSTIDGQRLQKMSHTAAVSALAFSPSGDSLLTGSNDKTVKLWSKTGRLLRSFTAHADKVLSVAWLPGGTGFISTGRDAAVKIWSFRTGTANAIVAHERRVNHVSISKDGRFFLTVSDDRTIRMWATLRGEPLAIFRGHSDAVTSVAFSQNGLSFVSGSEDGTVKMWQTESKVVRRFDSAAVGVYGLAFSTDKKRLLGAVGSGTRELGELMNNPNFDSDLIFDRQKIPRDALIWDTETGKTINILRGHKSGINAIVTAHDDRFYATASEDSTVIIWTKEGTIQHVLPHADKVESVALSFDNQWLVTVSDDSIATVWRTKDWTKATILRGGNEPMTRAIFMGNKILLGDRGGKLYFFETNGKLIKSVVLTTPEQIMSIAVSSDEQKLLAGNGLGIVYLLDAFGNILENFNINSKNITGASGVSSLAFSNDGKCIAIGSVGNIVSLFEIGRNKVGSRIQTMTGKFSGVYSLQFSPDDHQIFVGCGDGVVRVFKNIRFD